MSKELIDRLRPTLAEWERGNLLAGGEVLSPDVEVHLFVPGGIVVSRGLEEVVGRLRDDVFGQWGEYRIEVGRLVAIDATHVLLEGRQFGVGKRSGIEIADSLHVVFTFGGDRVTEMYWYPERADALAAAGLPG
jgi:hypothetical protein